jgi:hypothetical protein
LHDAPESTNAHRKATDESVWLPAHTTHPFLSQQDRQGGFEAQTSLAIEVIHRLGAVANSAAE